MACHCHLLDRASRLPGLGQEENMNKVNSSTLTAPSSSRTRRENCQQRRLLLSLDHVLIYGFCLLFALLLRVEGSNIDGCSKVTSSDVYCRLRTINSEFDKTNFSAISGESIKSLTIECSNILFYQSSLMAGSLAHLSQITNLHIEHCKLSRLSPGIFSGLSHLKNITVRTHNTAWPALSLDIASGVFNSPGNSLEKIDISSNNIWTFPEGLFCGLPKISSLNVSHNRLQDVNVFSGCNHVPIKVLDISSNRIFVLTNMAFKNLSFVQELYLQSNEISVLAERSFAYLTELRVLNLTNNKISTLPASLFQDNKEIAEIYLQNNSLVSLPLQIFSGLEHLVVLDISHNSLTSNWFISGGSTDGNATTETTTANGVFDKLIRLVLLDMGYNQLTRLHRNSFQDLSSLQILNLEHNLIENIEPNTFSSMNNLHTLILSHNKLSSIDATALNGLFVLSLLSLDNNEISEIHPQAFKNCSSLKDLNLNGNTFSEISLALQHLTLLKTVDIGECQINRLDSTSGEPILIGLPNLYGLRVTGNRIVNVSKGALTELPSLRVLNLARNRIQTVEKGAFDSNTNLQAVRLDSNFIQDISNLFSDLPSLIWLNVSDNHLSWFDYAIIPKQLQWLDLHKNGIAELGNYYQKYDLHLQTLDASFNQITRIGPNTIPDSIEMLFLNDNQITTVEADTFYNKVNLSRVDIFANQIETLEIRSLQLSPFPTDKPLPEFYIAGNPIICDCKIEWIQRLDKHIRQYPNVMDLDSVYCKLLYHHENSFIPMMEANPDEFLCKYEKHCYEVCSCCDFDACDCAMTCAPGCNCFHDSTWGTNIVSCSNQQFSEIPAIPMDATEVELSGNKIPIIKSHTFIGKKNLKTLFLNNTGIRDIQNNSFSGLKLLTKLYLSQNSLTTLKGYEFENLNSLVELYLDNNHLSFIAENTFSHLNHLEILKLNGNKLSTFSMWTLSNNPYIVELSLSGNPWSCECNYVKQVAPYIQANIRKIIDAPGVNCQLNGRSLSLIYINGSKCSEIFALSGVSETAETKLPPYLPLLATVMAISLLIATVFIAVCRKRNLKIWATKCPMNQCYQTTLDDEQEKSRLYDAYIAYSLKDEAFVTELQQHFDHHRLCLHYKEFPVTSYIADTIVEAVECSKRTVLVLSKSFLQTEWSRFEYRSAIHSALRKGKRLIIITLGDLPRDLDVDMRTLTRHAKLLSVQDKGFWSKLQYCMPEPRRMQVKRPGSGSESFSSESLHNYTSSLGGGSTLPLNISSDSSSNSNHFHHYHPPPPLQPGHHMTMSHHHHHPQSQQQFYNTLGTNGFLQNGGALTPSHFNTSVNGVIPSNSNVVNNNSDSNTNNGNLVPPFPQSRPLPFPPRRPPPPPAPAPLWA